MTTFVSAHVHIITGAEVKRLGAYRFHSLPRINENLIVGQGPDELSLQVVGVTHMPVEDGETEWDGVVIVNCRIDT